MSWLTALARGSVSTRTLHTLIRLPKGLNVCTNTSNRIRLFSKNAEKVNSKVNSKDSKGQIKRLLGLAKDEKWKIGAAILLLGVSSTVTMALPFGIGRVIDIIYEDPSTASTPAAAASSIEASPTSSGAMPTTSGATSTSVTASATASAVKSEEKTKEMLTKLKGFCAVLLGVFFVGASANFGRIYLMQMTGNRIVQRLRYSLYSAIVRQDVAFFDRSRTGELVNRLSADTSLVGQTVTSNVSDGLRSTAQAVAGLSMMTYMAPQLTLMSLCIVPPTAIASKYYGKYVQSITRKVQDSLADSTTIAEEKLSNIRTVRAFSREDSEIKIYENKILQVLDFSKKEALAKASFWAMTGLSGNLIILSVFYNGGLMMSEHAITVGELSSFLLYAAFVGVSIGGMSTFYSELMKGLGASHRIWQLIDSKPNISLLEGRIPREPMLGSVTLRDVDFSYPQRKDVAVFKSLSLRVAANSLTAIVGPSGSGKSSVMALLLRYYDCDKGVIEIDGMDVTTLNPSWIRTNIGIVNQEPMLFSCSIADNIRYGSPNTSDCPNDVTDEQVIQASKVANAYDFIQAFPDGFDTLVGERGVMLSGGQKQRIAIARAILKNPRILLFDEATSALDSESEYLVQEAMQRITRDRTVISIAHRLSTIKHADNIAVLDQGRIVESGSYEELISQNGQFKKLVDRQMLNNGSVKIADSADTLVV